VSAHELPLFPLHTVLFPGGELSLRVFEARYLDLVSECSRSGRGFGICLILDGAEVGAPAVPAAIGCEARIVDFSSKPDGLLVLALQGARRFRVERSRVRDNGLVVGQVHWLDEPPAQPLRPEHQLLATLLQRIHDRAGPPHDQFDKALLDDAGWVGWRLAEWLPMAWPQRQELLQQSDPHARLQRLVELIPDYQES
jgi:Lon protease-like protein